ncbi:MAG: polyprenyl synthetase family protein, partial [Oscillospiraceae bacterium]|nr:polyprenyl synthetase family protein [Oscillospiraceae bacterium]
NQELLGKEVGHDEASSKATYPALYGLEESKEKLRQLTDAAKEALAEYYDNAELFVDLAEMLATRVY